MFYEFLCFAIQTGGKEQDAFLSIFFPKYIHVLSTVECIIHYECLCATVRAHFSTASLYIGYVISISYDIGTRKSL